MQTQNAKLVRLDGTITTIKTWASDEYVVRDGVVYDSLRTSPLILVERGGGEEPSKLALCLDEQGEALEVIDEALDFQYLGAASGIHKHSTVVSLYSGPALDEED